MIVMSQTVFFNCQLLNGTNHIAVILCILRTVLGCQYFSDKIYVIKMLYFLCIMSKLRHNILENNERDYVFYTIAAKCM